MKIDAILKFFFCVLLLNFSLLGCGGDYSEDSSFVSSAIMSGVGSDGTSLVFIESDTPQIALTGSGGDGLPDTAKLTYQLLDDNGEAIAGATINFELSTSEGGVSLTSTSAKTNNDGLAYAYVSVDSGTSLGSVSVNASLKTNPDVYTSSTELVVNSGMPDQNSFSISIETFNSESWSYDGEAVSVSVRAADHFGNPAPVGTTVSFSTEGGSIEPSCQIDNTGACTVIWRSQNPRPADGRVTILAVAIGEESYTDSNGNGMYEQSDLFVAASNDLSEAYRDDNENGKFDKNEEEPIDFNSDGRYTTGNGIYNGSLASKDAINSGYATNELVHIRKHIVHVMSSSFARIKITPTFISLSANNESVPVQVHIEDVNGNSMPVGTTITFETSVGSISEENSCQVLNTNARGGLTCVMVVEGWSGSGDVGTLKATVTSPKGHVSTQSIAVHDELEEAEQVIDAPAAVITSILFVSSEPKTIALAGTGGSGIPETSKLIFQIMDENGSSVSDARINFELSTSVGGITLSNYSTISDQDGNAAVFVNSGTTHTTVSVRAVLDSNKSISANSNELVISSGLPDQNSFSLSADIFNPEGWNYDGIETKITIRAADHFGNPSPAGTLISFAAEGGSIDSSCALNDQGGCEVTWRSQNPRPSDGRVTILAYAIGEESFIDHNGDGKYDSTDTNVTDIGEAFRDDNENGIFDISKEESIDYNTNYQYDSKNGMFNGILSSSAAISTNDATSELIHVRDSLVLAMAGSHAQFEFSSSSIDLVTSPSQTILVTIKDVNDGPMPNGTTIAFAATVGTIITDASFTVQNTLDPLEYYVTFAQSGEGPEIETGVFSVKVTTPLGNLSGSSINMIDLK